MKKILSTLIGLALFAGITVNLQAGSWSTNAGAAMAWRATTGGGLLQTLSITPTGLATRVTIYDAPTTNYYWVQAYTNATVTAVTVTDIYTNRMASTGGTTWSNVLVTNIYTAVTNALAVVDGVTNFYPIIGSWTVPSNSTLNVTFTTTPFLRGIYVTNTTGGSYAVTWR